MHMVICTRYVNCLRGGLAPVMGSSAKHLFKMAVLNSYKENFNVKVLVLVIVASMLCTCTLLLVIL